MTNITQNLSSITQTGIPPRLAAERSGSLPPSSLPRPPRSSLKPPRKIDYDRLSDANMKTRSETPPKLNSAKSPYELKTSSLKRSEFGRREFSPTTTASNTNTNKNYIEMKDSLQFSKPDYTTKRKDYGTIIKTEFSKPDYTSTRNYQRLEDSPKPSNKLQNSDSLKRSLLSNVRKFSPAAPGNSKNNNSRDSLNSSESSSNSNTRSSPLHTKSDSNASNMLNYGQNNMSRTPSTSKYAPLTAQEKSYLASARHHQQQQQQRPQHPLPGKSSSLIPNKNMPCSSSSSASLPPKPVDLKTSTRRGSSSLSRGENRYRIQF